MTCRALSTWSLTAGALAQGMPGFKEALDRFHGMDPAALAGIQAQVSCQLAQICTLELNQLTQNVDTTRTQLTQILSPILFNRWWRWRLQRRRTADKCLSASTQQGLTIHSL